MPFKLVSESGCPVNLKLPDSAEGELEWSPIPSNLNLKPKVTASLSHGDKLPRLPSPVAHRTDILREEAVTSGPGPARWRAVPRPTRAMERWSREHVWNWLRAWCVPSPSRTPCSPPVWMAGSSCTCTGTHASDVTRVLGRALWGACPRRPSMSLSC
jgi:hypothetical protein